MAYIMYICVYIYMHADFKVVEDEPGCHIMLMYMYIYVHIYVYIYMFVYTYSCMPLSKLSRTSQAAMSC